jgi:hypothetical protein
MLGFGLVGRKISIKGITYFGHYSIYSHDGSSYFTEGVLLERPKKVLGIKENHYAVR